MLPVFVRAADHGKSQRIVIILIGLINATCYHARLLSENEVKMKPYLRLIRQDGAREFFAGTNDVLSQWLVLFNIHACMLTCVMLCVLCSGPPVPTGGSLLLYICSKSDLLRGVVLRLWRRVLAAVLIVLRASRPHGRLTFAAYVQ